MLNELVLSFILKSWRDLEKQILSAQTYVESLQSLESEMQTSQLLLCGLEKKGLLSFDQRWIELEKLEVPEACHVDHVATVYKKIRIRSSSIGIADSMNPWDHKIEVGIGTEPLYSLYLRQDKKYVGAHSTKGWSAWIERKTGSFRFEYVNPKNNTHLRMRASGQLHPLKGDLQKLDSLDAVQVSGVAADLKAALVKVTGTDGFKLWGFGKQDGKWQGTKKICSLPGTCESSAKPEIDENSAQQFGQTNNLDYQNFLEKGHPLAFQKIEASELVPAAAPYR